jgi:hypothetical protein
MATTRGELPWRTPENPESEATRYLLDEIDDRLVLLLAASTSCS